MRCSATGHQMFRQTCVKLSLAQRMDKKHERIDFGELADAPVDALSAKTAFRSLRGA